MSLVERAEALQTEAQELFTQLDLGTAFPWQPVLIGSALSGLMVVRDLDVMFDAPDATAPMIVAGLSTLAQRVELHSIDFRDEQADRRPTPAITDERFYAVLHTPTWKIDLTFWRHITDRPQLAHAQRLLNATKAERLTILQLKEACPETSSTDIYAAVLNHAVQTPPELDNYLSASR